MLAQQPAATPATVATSATRVTGRPSRRLWVHHPVADIALGWCWLPVALAVHAAEADVGRVQGMIGIIFLISFAHQPLTLGLVYGDPVQRAAHRGLYLWTPLVAAALIVVGLNVSLTLVALMAGLWNSEHTLMQRYGVLRIYGRKAGDDHGRLEKPMLIAWLLAALAFIAGYVDLRRLVAKLGFGGTNARSVHLLDGLHRPAGVLFWPVAVVAVVLSIRWWVAERSLGNVASRPKHLYALGTLGLLVAVMIDPIAGVAGYVAAHAIEYFGIVHSSLRHRSDAAPIARASRTRRRRIALYGAYFVGIAALVHFTATPLHGAIYAFAVLFLGALHILYDGLVWKLRRPAVAASLGIAAGSSG